MKAAVFEREGVLTVKDIPTPKIEKSNQMLVKIELCSVCGTDVHMTAVPPGYPAKPGTILGHELVGEVIEVGADVQNFVAGDRLVVNPNDYCGVCTYCRMNLPNQCENIQAMGIEVDGGFAEYVRLTEQVAFKIPPDMKSEVAAFAEPLACALNAMQKVNVKPTDNVVVIGAGPIGMLFIQLMRVNGAATIISIEPNEKRRVLALECGAGFAIDPTSQDAKAFVYEKTGIGADLAVDVVGSQIMTGIDCIRKGGTVLLFGNNAKAQPVVTQSEITYKEARVQGTWLANATFPDAVKMLSGGKLKLDFMVTHTLPLAQAVDAIELMRKGEGIEVFIDPRI